MANPQVGAPDSSCGMECGQRNRRGCCGRGQNRGSRGYINNLTKYINNQSQCRINQGQNKGETMVSKTMVQEKITDKTKDVDLLLMWLYKPYH